MKEVKKTSVTLKNISQKVIQYVGFVVLILLIISLVGGISRMRNVASKVDREKEKVEKLKRENQDLLKDLEIAKSQEFIEKQLRDNLGLAKDGEIVVILPDDVMVKRFAPDIDDEEKVFMEPNWKKWMKAFGLI